MPKAFVCVTGCQRNEDGQVHLVCHVVLHGTDDMIPEYGTDLALDPALSLQENIDALKTHVLSISVSRGHTMSTGDVIVFGAPVAKDTVSANDKTFGITSDKDATDVTPTVKEEPLPFGTRVAAGFKQAFDWMMG